VKHSRAVAQSAGSGSRRNLHQIGLLSVFQCEENLGGSKGIGELAAGEALQSSQPQPHRIGVAERVPGDGIGGSAVVASCGQRRQQKAALVLSQGQNWTQHVLTDALHCIRGGRGGNAQRRIIEQDHLRLTGRADLFGPRAKCILGRTAR
jgi:hypothetical protein